MTPVSQPLAHGQAPGKIILFGEHAVVYGRPAIAVPVQQVQAHAHIYPGDQCTVEAVDIHQQVIVAQAPDDDPFALMVRLICQALDEPLPPWRIIVTSDIPIAAGLGSGAAIAAAIGRAMLAGFGRTMPLPQLSHLVYQVEKIHHGTPSGIDNTVVVYQQPIWFRRGHPPEPFTAARPLHFLIADTGVPSPTRIAVGDVRRAWETQPTYYEALFDQIGKIALQARTAIEQGAITDLGPLMTANQALLTQLNVSSPELETLIQAALDAGALGAKLSGAGRGGNMIALVEPDRAAAIANALRRAGACRVIPTTLTPPPREV